VLYVILIGENPSQLDDLVRVAIQGGYRPQGGVAVVRFEEQKHPGECRTIQWRLVQAMVKE
jgi:hypothetical protein